MARNKLLVMNLNMKRRFDDECKQVIL